MSKKKIKLRLDAQAHEAIEVVFASGLFKNRDKVVAHLLHEALLREYLHKIGLPAKGQKGKSAKAQ